MAEYAHPDVLVDTQWLADHLNDPTVRVIEVGDDELAYIGGHIPGAVFWDFYKTILRPDLHTETDPERVGAILSAAGITPETLVVLVGAPAGMGPWGFWWLRLFGHQPLRVLDGGRPAWLAAGLPLTRDLPTHLATTYPVPAPDPALRVEMATMRAALGQPGTVVVDVRSPDEYRGAWFVTGPPGEGERGGHMPGAIHLFYRQTFAKDGTLLPAESLRALYIAHGITPDQDVIAYCMVGQRAAHTWFVLRYLLRYPQVRNYDGSWNEWGRQADTPVEQ